VKTTVYDPPSGWKYGFPKPYKPLTDSETLTETLLRDGYPQAEISAITVVGEYGSKRLRGIRFLEVE
jgi:hypothetical protein